MSAAPEKGSTSHHLTVTFRRVQGEESDEERVLAVFCPRQARAVGLTECRQCSHCQGLCVDPSDRQTFLRCTAEQEPEDAELAAAPEPSDHGAASGHPTRLGEIMTAKVRTIAADTTVGELMRIFLEEAISAVPVVNARGRAIGLVSKTDVLQRLFKGEDAPPEVLWGTAERADQAEEFSVEIGQASATPVRDIMTHMVFSLGQDAPISRAAALMSYEGIHRIVITAQGGDAIGIVSSLDILRWMARRDGYIVPGRTQRQSDAPGRPE